LLQFVIANVVPASLQVVVHQIDHLVPRLVQVRE
jgi:hypothetical protein